MSIGQLEKKLVFWTPVRSFGILEPLGGWGSTLRYSTIEYVLMHSFHAIFWRKPHVNRTIRKIVSILDPCPLFRDSGPLGAWGSTLRYSTIEYVLIHSFHAIFLRKPHVDRTIRKKVSILGSYFGIISPFGIMGPLGGWDSTLQYSTIEYVLLHSFKAIFWHKPHVDRTIRKKVSILEALSALIGARGRYSYRCQMSIIRFCKH